MSTHLFLMWQDGKKILLDDILRRISIDCEISWILYEFSGTGTAPNALRMQDFERAVRQPSGYKFASDVFMEFSRAITDIYDIKVAGLCDTTRVVEIHGFDSDDWKVFVNDELARFDGNELLTK